ILPSAPPWGRGARRGAVDAPLYGRGRPEERAQTGEAALVVEAADANHFVRLVAPVNRWNLGARPRIAGRLLVGEEVVPQAVDERLGTITGIAPEPVYRIVLQDRDDLVVSLVAIEHSQAADRNRLQEKVAMRKILLGQYTDVERIAVAYDPAAPKAFPAKRTILRPAEGLWNEAVQAR